MPVIQTRPIHSLILVMGDEMGDIPLEMDGPVAATSSCIVIATHPEMDGETELWLGSANMFGPAQRNGLEVIYTGQITTPLRWLRAYATNFQVLAETPVLSECVRVSVLTNGVNPTRMAVVASTSDGDGRETPK